MKASRILLLVVCIAATLSMTGLPAQGDLSDRLTYFTFSGPAEIPGGKVLPAGTYAFKVVDTLGNRNIVQIFNKGQNQLYATVLTIPDYRQNPSDKPVIQFSETAAGGPPAIKEWFYPGDSYGNEFVYPKNRAVELAKAANQAVPSMPTQMTSNINQTAAQASSTTSMQQMKDASLKAEQPNGDEVEVAEVFIVAPDAAGGNAPEATQVATSELPKTASDLPLLGLIGLLFIVGGAAFWLALRNIVTYSRRS